eukprot:9044962-Alexandrium_andersonii.AAC.2
MPQKAEARRQVLGWSQGQLDGVFGCRHFLVLRSSCGRDHAHPMLAVLQHKRLRQHWSSRPGWALVVF